MRPIKGLHRLKLAAFWGTVTIFIYYVLATINSLILHTSLIDTKSHDRSHDRSHDKTTTKLVHQVITPLDKISNTTSYNIYEPYDIPHDTSHDTAHDRSHDTSHDRSHDTSHDTSHDISNVKTYDIHDKHDKQNDMSHDISHDPKITAGLVYENLAPHQHKLAEKCRKELNSFDNNCPNLFHHLHKEKIMSTKCNSKDCVLTNLLDHNCSTLHHAHEYVTDTNQVMHEERIFPLAFAIKIHDNPEQMEQLLRNIYRPHNVYCIHVDKKTDDKIFNIVQRLGNCFPNVFVLMDRIDVVYRSLSMVIAELLCMEKLLMSDVQWKYYLNLAGTEFPLKTNLEIVKILKMMKGKNVIHVGKKEDVAERVAWRYIFEGNLMINTSIPKKTFPHNVTLIKSNTYGAFTRAFVEFILTDKLAEEYILWLNDTMIPDEIIWSMNTFPHAPDGNTGRKPIARFINWYPWFPCHGEYVRDICVFGVGDLPLLHSRPELIANKFMWEFDRTSVDCLEELIRNRTRDPTFPLGAINWSFYKQLHF